MALVQELLDCYLGSNWFQGLYRCRPVVHEEVLPCLLFRYLVENQDQDYSIRVFIFVHPEEEDPIFQFLHELGFDPQGNNSVLFPRILCRQAAQARGFSDLFYEAKTSQTPSGYVWDHFLVVLP